MCCLPTERDEDLVGIIDILKEATIHCRAIKKTDPAKYRRDIEFTCTISNFVPKPFTPFQWFAQVTPEETRRKHRVLRDALRESPLKHVTLNVTDPQISLLEAAISRGGRETGELIFDAWRLGCTLDAWEYRLQAKMWQEAAAEIGVNFEGLACGEREVGSDQPWDVVHIGLNNWWMVKEWEKAMAQLETAPCTENLCHACGVCTELDATHLLAQPKVEVMKRNPFVKELCANQADEDHHPSLFFVKPQAPPPDETATRIRFKIRKLGDLRFISHLDLQSLLARACRRAFINIAYSKGFNPQPKLALAAALPLFHESHDEVAEVEIAENMAADEFRTKLNEKLPFEIQVLDARSLTEKAGSSLSALLVSARYRVTVTRMDDGSQPPENLRALLKDRAAELLASASVVTIPADQTAKPGAAPKKPRDIRPGIVDLKLTSDSPLSFEFELLHSSQLFVKPSELLPLFQPPHLVPMIVWRVTRPSLRDQTTNPFSMCKQDLNDQSTKV